MSIPLREFGETGIQNKNISDERVQTWPQFHVVQEASGDSTTLLPLCCPIPSDPTAYYAEPSLWSLSLAKRYVDLLLAFLALLLSGPCSWLPPS
jgi:hypothetical protein